MDLAYYLVGMIMGMVLVFAGIVVYVRYFGPISIDLEHRHE